MVAILFVIPTLHMYRATCMVHHVWCNTPCHMHGLFIITRPWLPRAETSEASLSLSSSLSSCLSHSRAIAIAVAVAVTVAVAVAVAVDDGAAPCAQGSGAAWLPFTSPSLQARRAEPGVARYESHGVQVPLCFAGAWSGSLGAHTPLESAALALNSCTSTVRRRTMSWLGYG